MKSLLSQEFIHQSALIIYADEFYEKMSSLTNDELTLLTKDNLKVKWFNTYGHKFYDDFKIIIKQSNLDDFLLKLLKEDHNNKVIELEKLLFIAVKVLKTDDESLYSEQMYFIMTADMLWTIQEKKGDYFEWIRDRILNKKGLVRTKKVDYLLYLILESIIDNYEMTFKKLADKNDQLFMTSKLKSTPDFTNLVETKKQEMYVFQKAAKELRDIITKFEKVQEISIKNKYFNELKEQVNNLVSDIEFEIQELESTINLIFSIQGHRLNEVMKTLTIFSVIFIPLTFIAGIYGMNFKNMPELNMTYGYFIVLGVMTIITLFFIWYFKRKKWF